MARFFWSSAVRWACVVLGVLVCAGCVSTNHPRPADVAPPGGWSGDLHAPVIVAEAGRAHVVGQEPRPPEGETPWTDRLTLDNAVQSPFPLPVAVVPMPIWVEASARYGVFEGCEAGGLIGLFRQGVEARCGVLQERWGHPLSVAFGGVVALVPFYDDVGPWWSASMDTSVSAGATARLMARVSLTHGPERRAVLETPPVRLWDPPPDPNVADAPSAALWFERTETRIALAVGLGLTGEADDPVEIVVGFTPYWVIDHAAPHAVGCDQCPTVRLERWEAGFGAGITLGAALRP